jgi:hypothetical protein
MKVVCDVLLCVTSAGCHPAQKVAERVRTRGEGRGPARGVHALGLGAEVTMPPLPVPASSATESPAGAPRSYCCPRLLLSRRSRLLA